MSSIDSDTSEKEVAQPPGRPWDSPMGAGRGSDNRDHDGEYDDDMHHSVVSFADVERIDPALVTVPTDNSSQGPRRTDAASTSQSTGDYESPGVVRSSRSDVMGRGKGGGERTTEVVLVHHMRHRPHPPRSHGQRMPGVRSCYRWSDKETVSPLHNCEYS
jgi:hypothetical protein